MKILASLISLLALTSSSLTAADTMLTLHLRSLPSTENPVAPAPTTKSVRWDPKKTAIIICDMWDDHWCKSAARRVAEMAGPRNGGIKQTPTQGAIILPAPSSGAKF